MPYGFVAGHFTATYNGTSIGSTTDGFHLTQTPIYQPIHDDEAGDGEVDGVQQGANYRVPLNYIEYSKVYHALYAQVPEGKLYDNVGRLLTQLFGPLVLTPIPGTSAEVELGAGNSIICPKAGVINDIPILLASKLRQGPIEFRLFPWDIGGSGGGDTRTVYYIGATPE